MTIVFLVIEYSKIIAPTPNYIGKRWLSGKTNKDNYKDDMTSTINSDQQLQ